MSTTSKALAALSLSFVSLSAYSAACTNDSFVIQSMTNSITNAVVTLPSGGIGSTSCFGVADGNDAQGGTLEPNWNLGYLNDGLLNGQGGKLSPTQFISPDQLQALKDPTKPVDPGWIMLGTVEGNEGELDYYGEPLDIGDLLTFNLMKDGTWRLTTVANIVEILNDAGIFNRNYFDHLAFAVKAGNQNANNGGGWAVYDFDFNLLLKASPGLFDLTQPYSFTGTWNMDDFGGKEISHLSVWADRKSVV